MQTTQVLGQCVSLWIHGSFQSSAFFESMESSLSDEYLVRCLTPSRSGKIKPLGKRTQAAAKALPAIFRTEMNRSDPRAVAAMVKYLGTKKLTGK